MRSLRIAAAAIILAGALLSGGRRFVADLPTVFRFAPTRVVSPEMEAQVRWLRARMPPNASLLYLGNQRPPDDWQSRLWARAFYPTPVLILESGETPVPDTKDLGKRYPIRYALSAGNPPDDPGFAWHIVLPAQPGVSVETWFGELRP